MTKYNMRYDEFLQCVDMRTRETKERWGQAFFNALVEVRPELAAEIRGKEIDPFYYDKGYQTARAIRYVGSRWTTVS